MIRFTKLFAAIAAILSINACATGTDGVFPGSEDNAADATTTVTNVVNGADASTTTDATVTADIPVTATPACEDKDGDKICPPLDCDDNNPNVHPGAKEVCNGVDDNCDGKTDPDMTESFYKDKDQDGYGLSTDVTTVCIGTAPPKGYVKQAGDCNDSAEDMNGDGKVDGFWIHKDATETCDDGIDNNCAGGTDEGCAPEFTDLKTGDNFAIAVTWPSDKVGQKIFAVEYYTEHDVDIGAEWTLKEASATSNVMIIVPDGNACGVRFQTAYGSPKATEWLVSQVDDKGTVELNKSATILLIKADGSITDITSIVTTWEAPEGGGSAKLTLHDCK